MASKEQFQEKIRQLGALIGVLDAQTDECSNKSCRELIQLLMEVHGTALQRVLEIVDQSGNDGEQIIARAGNDPIVRPLLVLYSLHPETLETRVVKALDEARPRLRKLNAEAELVGMCDGAVKVRIRTTGHACGSTSKTVQSTVEECIYDFAPDLTSLEIIAPAEESATGFVSIESLLQHPTPAPPAPVQQMQPAGAD